MPIGLVPEIFGGTPASAAGGQGGLAGLADPRMLALLGVGGGLLEASQPSRVPVGLGQAMTGGLQRGLGGLAIGRLMQREDARDEWLRKTLSEMYGLDQPGDASGLEGGIGGRPPPRPSGANVVGRPLPGAMARPTLGGLY